jgi:hypothetical protein
MLIPLALSLLTAVAPAAPAHDDPPIRLRLSEETYSRGDRAKVRVRADQSGYLVVLRADADGRVRVLFPISPDDDALITGRKDFEIRSRGDRDAFIVNETSGAGTVVAVWSDQPFRFDEFSKNGRWDYRALSVDSTSGADESGLLDLVDRMTDAKYAYDVAQYTVDDSPPASRHYRAGYYYDPYWSHGSYWGPYYGPRWRIGIGWGGRWHRRW